MGQGQSVDQPKVDPGLRVSRSALRKLSELDKLSLKEQSITAENLPTILGIAGITGADVFLRSAQFFASYPNGLYERLDIAKNIPKVLGFYRGTLIEELNLSADDYYRLIFLSIAATGQGSPPPNVETSVLSVPVDNFYIAYQDLLDLWTLLVTVSDKSPADKYEIIITKKDKSAAERLIRAVKAPVISYSSFVKLLHLYPGILESFSIIFDQVLYPHRESPPPLEDKRPDIPRDLYCELKLSLGPNVDTMVKLYRGSEHGFSMQALYSKVREWRVPSLLIVTGRLVQSPTPLLDNFVPKLSGVKTRNVKRVAYAVYIHSDWRQVGNFGDPQTKLLQLAPDFNVYNAIGTKDHAYFSLRKGLSFGVPLPKEDDANQTVRVGNVSLVLDNSFEYGVFRQLGPGGAYSISLSSPDEPFEDRFAIDNIDLWGIGDKDALEEQSRKLHLKEKFIKNQRRHNDPEDRALLEMAGLVGQYPT